MLTAGVTETIDDLSEILALQKRNLKQHLSPAEKAAEGFLTMQFSLSMLKELHDLAPSVVVRDEKKIVAYAIVLLNEGRHSYPDLESMFVNLETLRWKERPLTDYRYYVMGQICVDKDYRGQHVFDMLYQQHRKLYNRQFDCIVTEISTTNSRSMRAHERTGFKTIHRYTDHLDEWNVVLWDWN